MAWITKSKKKRAAVAPTERRKERQKVYQSQRWQRLRLYYLSEHPLCEDCLERGVIKDAVDVHHIESFVGKEQATPLYAFNYSNLRALCKECHQHTHNYKKHL